MAIRHRGNSWQVYYRDADGRIVTRSFKDHESAEKENARVLSQNKDNRGRRIMTAQNMIPPVDNVAKLSAVFVEYLHKKNFTEKAIKSQFSILRPILNLCGDMDVKKITPQYIEEIKDTLIATETSRATTNSRLRLFRTVLYFAVSKGLMDGFKFPLIPSPHYKKNVPPTPQELQEMYAVAAPHIQRVIILGAYCGMRVGACEMFQLTWEDVDLSKNLIRIHGAKKNEDCEYREVPIRADLQAVFAAWQDEDLKTGTQYLISYKGKPVSSIKTAWSRTLRDAGITRSIRPYDLRHAFGTELVAAGVDIGTVAKLMGHSSPSMLLKHYQYVLDKQKVEAVEKLPEIPCMAKPKMPY